LTKQSEEKVINENRYFPENASRWVHPFILTAIGIGLLLNAAGAFICRPGAPVSAFVASGRSEMRICDLRSTWP
jgi:hypothetical protein